jgi:AcrR family transcriptional regulator
MQETRSAPSISRRLTPDQSSRERLLQAAISVFECKGYAAASVREIVELAGVTKPVLYYHFGSKQGLIVSILEAAARDLRAVVEEAARTAGPTRERIVSVCQAVHRMVRQRTSELRVLHAVYYTAAALVPQFDFEVFDRTLVSAFEHLVADGIAAGELRRHAPADATSAILSVLMLALDLEVLGRTDRLDDAGLRRILDLVFDGICRHS